MIAKSPLHLAAAVVVLVAGLVATVPDGAAATSGTPPNCSAIAFRPILARSGDGDQDAGLYKSRYGRIEVKATVKDGATQNYFVEINGKPLAIGYGPAERDRALCQGQAFTGARRARSGLYR